MSVDEAEYCSFMSVAAYDFFEQKNYHFAYLAYHILFMYQIYVRLWQLAKIQPDRVIDALSLAHYDKKDAKPYGTDLRQVVINAASPMTFKIFKIEERVFVKILTLLECEDYAPYKKVVDFRNELAHPNGTLPLKDELNYEARLDILFSLMKDMHINSANTLEAYLRTMLSGQNYRVPYAETEIINDVDQLFVSQVMASPYDCTIISSHFRASMKKVDRIAFAHLGELAAENESE